MIAQAFGAEFTLQLVRQQEIKRRVHSWVATTFFPEGR
jgi:hypothetical protein